MGRSDALVCRYTLTRYWIEAGLLGVLLRIISPNSFFFRLEILWSDVLSLGLVASSYTKADFQRRLAVAHFWHWHFD